MRAIMDWLMPLGCCPAGRERVHRWWHTKQLSMTENVIMGKPSVLFRKLINTQDDDGNLVAVNAQQYAVLVMDVPDLAAEREKCASTQFCFLRIGVIAMLLHGVCILLYLEGKSELCDVPVAAETLIFHGGQAAAAGRAAAVVVEAVVLLLCVLPEACKVPSL